MLHKSIEGQKNTVAVMVNHMAGNMRIRWTNINTYYGEKTSRTRNNEFLIQNNSKVTIIEKWESGWYSLFAIIDNLKDSDLSKIVFIRGERHLVIEAINRQLAHYSYHIGQMVFLSKHLLGSDWKSLSIPLNKSEEYNLKKFKK